MAVTVTALGARRHPRVASPWYPGDRIAGIYLLRALLGQGGMSTVWDAWDGELYRPVALKVVDGEDGGDLVLHEARALSAVRHPGLPVVYGVGEHRGRRFLVLERLFGETLEETLRAQGGRLELDESLAVLAAVASALHAVHQAGMAHHDVKPANIMRCRADRVVLLDLGIMLPEVGAAAAPRAGTAGYLAPEAVLGAVAPGRARLLDVYAFGVTAFELLTGRALFPDADGLTLLQHHVFTPAPRLDAVRPDLPAAVATLVASCLAKVPDDRPDDMEAIAAELRRARSLIRAAAAGPGPRRAGGRAPR